MPGGPDRRLRSAPSRASEPEVIAPVPQTGAAPHDFMDAEAAEPTGSGSGEDRGPASSTRRTGRRPLSCMCALRCPGAPTRRASAMHRACQTGQPTPLSSLAPALQHWQHARSLMPAPTPPPLLSLQGRPRPARPLDPGAPREVLRRGEEAGGPPAGDAQGCARAHERARPPDEAHEEPPAEVPAARGARRGWRRWREMDGPRI